MLRAFSYHHPQISPLKFLKSPISSSFKSPMASFSTNNPLIQAVEHIVLFKVRESTNPSKIEAMLANLRHLSSLKIATHLTVAPIFRLRSSAASDLAFTHILHSRFFSKPDLTSYSDHPSHLQVVRENVLPICDDIMALDWVDENVDLGGDLLPGSLVRVTFAKPREGVAGTETVRAIDGVRVSDSVKLSYGENFSPGRAKGYEVGFVAVFRGVDEANSIEGDEEVEKQKEKLRELVESVIVVDYLAPSPASSL